MIKQLHYVFTIFISLIAGTLFLSLFSCGFEEKLHQRYNQGYSDGNKSGYNKGYNKGYAEGKNEGFREGNKYGYNNGYNVAKNEYQKKINELQNRITTMGNTHKTQLVASYNQGFNAGEISMEGKILAIVDINTQQKIKKIERMNRYFA